MVITSCGRRDLLDKTISSLMDTDWGEFSNKIIIEDSGDAEMNEYLHDRYHDVFDLILCNERNLGKHASIDKAYSYVETEYVFHCEDDWFFYRKGFVRDSLTVLENCPAVSMVGLRSFYWDYLKHHAQFAIKERYVVECVPYYTILDESPKNPMNGYSLNPGLRRLEDVRRMGSHAELGGEYRFSAYFLARNMEMVVLENAAVDHIGWGRGLNDPKMGKYLQIKKLKNLAKAILNLFGANYILHN